MPGFDTSNVAAEVGQGPQQQNPIQLIEGLAFARNAMNQNRMFQSQQAAGQAFQGAIGPDGTVNQNAFMTSLAGNPQASYAALEAAREGAAYQGQAIGNQQAGLALAGTRYANLQSVLAPAAALHPSDPVAQQRDMIAAVAVAKNAGIIDPGQADYVAQNGTLPSGQPLRDFATEAATAGAGGSNTADALIPHPVVTDTGQNFVTQQRTVGPEGVNVAPAGGTGAVLSKGLAPGDLASPVMTVDPMTGVQSRHTLGEYVNGDGTPKAGSIPPVTAIGPLSSAAQSSLGAAYGPQIAAFENSQPAVAQARQAVENARQEASQFTTGPASDQFMRWGELLSQFGVSPPSFASMPQTAAREAFRQSIIQVLRGQQAALHMDQTDAARQTAGLDVPGSVTTPEGMKTVLGTIEGNYDAQLAMGKVWQAQKSQGGASSWGQFQTEFPARIPPSIFQAQYNPDQIAAQQKGWSAAQKADWQARYNQAKKLGWLPNAQ